MKRKVQVEWVFARKPKPIATVKADDGHALPTGRHELRPEGVPVKRIWCALCRRYFGGWREVFQYHKVRRASGRRRFEGKPSPAYIHGQGRTS